MKGWPALTLLLLACPPSEAELFRCEHDCDGGELVVPVDDAGRLPVACDDGVIATARGCEMPVEVAVSRTSVCVRSAAGQLACSGLSGAPQRAVTSALTEVRLPEPALSLSGSESNGCVVGSSGRAYCWGANDSAELGNGAVTGSGIGLSTVIGGPYAAVSPGPLRMCGLLVDGGVNCWGQNKTSQSYYPLGFASAEMVVPTPQPVLRLTSAVQTVRCGQTTTWARASDGHFIAWGAWTSYENDRLPDPAPGARALAFGPAIAKILTLSSMGFALDVDGGVSVWGSVPGRPFGLRSELMFNADAGPTGYSSTLLPTSSPPQVSDVCAGDGHVCVLTTSKAIWCWGDNSYGQLGDGTFVSRADPQPIQQLTATALACSSDFTCATSTRGLVCWGRNTAARLGSALPLHQPIPQLVLR